jgi:hypothetical protein
VYGLEGLNILFLFLFLLLSGSLAGGSAGWRSAHGRRRPVDDEWETVATLPGSTNRARQRYAHMQVSLFRLAKRRGGVLTLSDIIIETGLSVQQAEEMMNALVDNIYVRLEVTEQGRFVYEFPELMVH